MNADRIAVFGRLVFCLICLNRRMLDFFCVDAQLIVILIDLDLFEFIIFGLVICTQ